MVFLATIMAVVYACETCLQRTSLITIKAKPLLKILYIAALLFIVENSILEISGVVFHVLLRQIIRPLTLFVLAGILRFIGLRVVPPGATTPTAIVVRDCAKRDIVPLIRSWVKVAMLIEL